MVSYKALNTYKERCDSDVCHTFGDSDGGQVVAVLESLFCDACHAFGNDDGGQAATIQERTESYARHTLGNDEMAGYSSRINT